jgi:hemerythrin superfamily protein
VDAITVLKDDHKLVRRLFAEFGRTTDRAVKTRERLARRLVKELSTHAAIEEQILYPRVREVLKKGDKLADHALAPPVAAGVADRARDKVRKATA